MLEAFGDIWDNIDDYDGIVITTNGVIKANGEAVLGRGIALEAVKRYPWLPQQLGSYLRQYGNTVGRFDLVPNFIRNTTYDQSLYTFPVKPVIGPNGEPGWKAKAQYGIIVQSIVDLIKSIDTYDYKKGYKVIMPRPGCGNGGLKWEDVKPIISPLLDDRFTVMEKGSF